MKLQSMHSWDISTSEALQLQLDLAAKVSRTSGIGKDVSYVAGLDISPPDGDGMVTGAAVVLEYPSLVVTEVKVSQGKPAMPYIPGLLSFRETPVLTHALEQLEFQPDIIYIDGQGLAHPRRFGLACHIGVLTGIPTIGCAKSVLVGTHEDLSNQAGSHALMMHKGEEVGMTVRTRENIKPMYVSIGHLVDLPACVKWVLACCSGRRMPEATRLAHAAAAGKLRIGHQMMKGGS